MYKMITIDLDGTMLNPYGEVTEYTKKVLKKAMNKGIDVVITSGRNIDAIKGIAEEIDAQKYIIDGNGSTIYDIQNDEIIYEKFIPKSKALDIIKICEENSIAYSVYTNKTIISRSLKFNVLYYYNKNLTKPQNKQTSITLVDDVYEYVQNMEEQKVLKVFICDKNQSLFNAISRKVSETIDGIEILDVSHMSRKIITDGTQEIPLEYFYTEIAAEDVDKWNAIEFLIEKLGIKPEEVIAIGDNINDKKMIEKAGLGIALKGSTPKITEVADYVTEFDNNNDGAAKAIEKYI